MPGPVRYAIAKGMLEAKGYFLDRVRGSHHMFRKTGVGTFSMPVHKGMVKYVYIKQIEKL